VGQLQARPRSPRLTGDGAPDGRGVSRRGLGVVWRAVRTHPGPFALAVAGSTLFAVTAVVATVVLGRIIDDVLVPALDGGSVEGDEVLVGVAALLGVALLRSVGVTLRRYFGSMTVARMQVTWRMAVADRYLDVPLEFHRRRPTGELLAHTDADVKAATEAIQPLPLTIGVAVMVVVALGSLVAIDPVLALAAAGILPGLALLNQWYASRVEAPQERAQARVGTVSAVAHESFDGALTVKALGREEDEVARLSTAADALRRERLVVGRLRAGFEPAIEALPSLGTVALLAVGTSRVAAGAVTTGQLVQAMALFGVLAFPVRVAGALLTELPRAAVGHDRLAGVLAEPVADVPHPDRRRPFPSGAPDVELEGVVHGYAGAAVLDGIDLRVERGEVVALVGATGAGKTTLCHLLARLEDPWDGTVRVAGVDLREADPAELRAAVALVFQDTFLFAGSIRSNLVLDGELDDRDLAWAMGVARVDEFVGDLRDGLATELGERGVTLSGGQRQRLALARALVRRPRLLVLDDATSAIDPAVEAEILAGLREVDATTVVVAQRVSTIALADRVLYLDGGRLAASGRHEELLAVPGYERLVRAYERAAAG